MTIDQYEYLFCDALIVKSDLFVFAVSLTVYLLTLVGMFTLIAFIVLFIKSASVFILTFNFIFIFLSTMFPNYTDH